jgi:polyhydroxybutyrate depolymerase
MIAIFRHIVSLFVLVLSVLFGGPSLAAETRINKLSVGGVERSYILSTAALKTPRPTIIVLHGGTLDAENARRSTGLEPLVDRDGFNAVYPNAIGGHWNDGRGSAQGWRSNAGDDTAFIRALTANLVRNGTADSRRIYVTGPSNGGMMTFRLICEAADLFAGAAPIIASLPADLAPVCKPVHSIPVLVMNGTADPLVPFGGGGVGYFGKRGRVLSTDETMTKLRQFNGCAETSVRERLPDRDPNDGSTVVIESWKDCSSGDPVVLYLVDGGGHRIPRRSQVARPMIDRLLGKENHDFEAADAIWAFFRGKKLK